MARFPFSMPSRKKSAPQLPSTAPLSKAHRVLGSTPLSIDSPPSHWHGGSSSSVFGHEPSGTTEASAGYLIPDARGIRDSHPASTAQSDDGWAADSHVLPHPLRLNAVDPGDCCGIDTSTIASSILRKRRSSSTIVSWYDKSKMPLAISQQTSSSAMAKGLPSKAERILHADDVYTNKPKRKPGKLDLSAIVAGARRSRPASYAQQDVGAAVLGAEYLTRSPSVLTPSSPSTRRFDQKMAKFDLRWRSTSAARRPGPDGVSSPWTPRSTLSELPSLYDHYEQMSLQQLLRHAAAPDAIDKDGQAGHAKYSPLRDGQERVQPLRDSILSTPQTMVTKFSAPSSSDDYALSLSSRHTRSSKSHRTAQQSLESADLHQTSVLILSSDSEDDDDFDSSTTTTTVTTATTTMDAARSPAAPRRASTLENDASLDAYSVKSKSTSSVEREASRTGKLSSRPSSFAPATTCTTAAGVNERSGPAHVEFRLDLSLGNVSQKTASPSRRASLMSTYSSNSAATWQSHFGHSIREARAMPMHSARPLSNTGSEQDGPQPPLQMELDHAVFHRNSLAGSADQLTPPLSPSSVDFYIRSGRSSIDGPGSHNRIMAVTRQEEMLLAALRHKQQSFRGNALASMQGSPSNDGGKRDRSPAREPRSQQRRSRGHRSRTPQSHGSDAMFDFGFPAPPGFKNDYSPSIDDGSARRHRSTSRHSSSRQSSRRRSSVAVVTGTTSTLSTGNGSLMLATPNSVAHKASPEPSVLPSPEETLMYLDMEPRPDLSDFQDWDAALFPVSEDPVSDAVRPAAQQKDSVSGRRGSGQFSRPHATLGQDDMARAIGGRLAEVAEESGDAEEGMPRPDSPISPESFPAVPQKRATGSSTARLSAVGPGPLSSGIGLAQKTEPGWWGDND